jgi:hypothetical protein
MKTQSLLSLGFLTILISFLNLNTAHAFPFQGCASIYIPLGDGDHGQTSAKIKQALVQGEEFLTYYAGSNSSAGSYKIVASDVSKARWAALSDVQRNNDYPVVKSNVAKLVGVNYEHLADGSVFNSDWFIGGIGFGYCDDANALMGTIHSFDNDGPDPDAGATPTPGAGPGAGPGPGAGAGPSSSGPDLSQLQGSLDSLLGIAQQNQQVSQDISKFGSFAKYQALLTTPQNYTNSDGTVVTFDPKTGSVSDSSNKYDPYVGNMWVSPDGIIATAFMPPAQSCPHNQQRRHNRSRQSGQLEHLQDQHHLSKPDRR